MLGLYKNEVCFFISSFLAGKEAKEAGGTYAGSPLTPFQRSTGTLSPSIAPAQGDIFFVSRQAEVGKYRAGDVPPPRYFEYELCGADFSFLIRRQCWDRVKKGRGKARVSHQDEIEKAPRGRKAKEGKS